VEKPWTLFSIGFGELRSFCVTVEKPEQSKEVKSMEQDTKMATTPQTSEPVVSSPAAERMRRHRNRRRIGLRCLTIELRETEIERLSRKGFLKADARNDPNAVREALYSFLESVLGPSS
jgi:hypothetical protein